MNWRLRPGARAANAAPAAKPAVATKAVGLMLGIPRVGIRAAPETSRKIGNGRPKPAARTASTVAAIGRTGFDEKSLAVAGLSLRLTSSCPATQIGTAAMHMPALCPIWRSDLEKVVNGLATDVG